MILGVGTDICEIARIAKALENPRFLGRWFTEAEKEYILSRGAANTAGIADTTGVADTAAAASSSGAANPFGAASAAGIFAAKEAVSKALGTGFSGFGPADVEILRDGRGKPFCVLHRGAKARAAALGAGSVMVSVSHDGGMAVAFALAQEEAIPASAEKFAEEDHLTEESL